MLKTVGERIRELREEKDLSLREFAKKLGGLSAAFLSDIELGRRHPSDKVLVRMAQVLGTTAEELRSYDSRAPVEDLKRMAISDPAYGLALRRMVHTKVTPDELMKLVDKAERLRKKK
jgi:transcriptional regulator with XRE-family HTH domain